MSTFAEMQSRIADDLNRTDLTTQIKKAINRAISHYSNEEFWFAETYSTFNCVADQETYGTVDGLPTDLRDIVLLQVTISGSDYILNRRSISYVREQDPSNNSGQPTDYAFFQQKIYLYPIPDDEYTIKIFYKKDYADLSATSDTNDFTTIPEAEELIENRAEWWLATRLLRDKELAELAKLNEQEALTVLRTVSGHFTDVDNLNRATDF